MSMNKRETPRDNRILQGIQYPVIILCDDFSVRPYISKTQSMLKWNETIMAEIGPSGSWGVSEALLTMIPNFGILPPETFYDCPEWFNSGAT